MKTHPAIILLILLACSAILRAQEPTTLIELPLRMHDGYGPFPRGYKSVGDYREVVDNPSSATYIYSKGIPEGWTEVKMGTIDTNPTQSLYQDYQEGKISAEFYADLQKSRNRLSDETILSRQPIQTKIRFVTGKDASGKECIIFDANNNQSFTDDPVYDQAEIPNTSNADNRPERTFRVSCEFFVNNEVVTRTVPIMMIKYRPGSFLSSIAQYATTELDGQQIALCSSSFADLSWDRTSILLMSDVEGITDKTALLYKLAAVDNYIAVNGAIYKNKGVNPNKNVLMLEKMTVPRDQLYSTQVGFRSPLFEGENFVNKEKISLEGLRGKYVLLDFWATWCGSCLKEMPNLKALYERTDRSRFEILGIVGGSKADQIKKVLQERSVTWPQIQSDEVNNITKPYNISGYPTVLLLDPDGMVIGRNLLGKELDKRIEELLNAETE